MSKKPVEVKGTPATAKSNKRLTFEDIGIGSNSFTLDAKLKAELDAKGLEPRFLSMKEIEKAGGFHPMGWKPYARESKDEANSFHFGQDNKGPVRRGDLILGVKSKEDAEKHRAYLAQEAKDREVSQKRDKRELRRYAQERGIEVAPEDED